MVSVTEGLEWPLKAVPQTLLYILHLFEVGRLPSCIGRLSEHGDVEISKCSAQSYRAIIICPDLVDHCGSSLVG